MKVPFIHSTEGNKETRKKHCVTHSLLSLLVPHTLLGHKSVVNIMIDCKMISPRLLFVQPSSANSPIKSNQRTYQQARG